MTRDEFIEMLKEKAEPDDFIIFDDPDGGVWRKFSKPSGALRHTADSVLICLETIEDGD